MLINKSGKIMANSAPIIVKFKTLNEYVNWYTTLPNPSKDLDKFVIIKEYENSNHSYYEAANLAALNSLSAANKIEGCIYGVKDTNLLYRYDSATNTFVLLGNDGTANNYIHDVTISFASSYDDFNIGAATGPGQIHFVVPSSNSTPVNTRAKAMKLAEDYLTAYPTRHAPTGKIPVDGFYNGLNIVYIDPITDEWPVYIQQPTGRQTAANIVVGMHLGGIAASRINIVDRVMTL